MPHQGAADFTQSSPGLHHRMDGSHHSLTSYFVGGQVHAKHLPIGPFVQRHLQTVGPSRTDDSRQGNPVILGEVGNHHRRTHRQAMPGHRPLAVPSPQSDQVTTGQTPTVVGDGQIQDGFTTAFRLAGTHQSPPFGHPFDFRLRFHGQPLRQFDKVFVRFGVGVQVRAHVQVLGRERVGGMRSVAGWRGMGRPPGPDASRYSVPATLLRNRQIGLTAWLAGLSWSDVGMGSTLLFTNSFWKF